MPSEFEPILRTIDLMEVERRELSVSGPRFVIYHRFWQPETICTPGEMIAEVRLQHRRKEVRLPLSLRLMLLFDYMARYRHLGQCAAQIAAGVTNDPFTRNHGAYAHAVAQLSRAMSRTAVKEHITRIRAGLRRALRRAGLSLDPGRVLVSESSTTNAVRYRLRASVTWQHGQF
jgi:hypothetical protein